MIDPTRKKDRGITLIELMIVLVIAGLVVGGVYTLFATQQRSYYVQDRVAGIQQDARAALTIMARDIRMAGFLTDSGGFTVNTFQFAVNPVNNNGANGEDSITVVLAAEECISSATGNPITVTGITSDQVTLSESEGNIGDGDFFDTSSKRYVAFEGEKQVYLISGGLDTTTLTLTQYPPSYLADVQARVFRVKAVTYQVQDNALKMDEHIGGGAQPLIGDGTTTVVEDLQFAYQVHGDTNWYNDPTTDFPAGTDQADIEMVRINITVRTAVQDATVQDAAAGAQYNQPALEDHTAGLNGPDGFRRRVYTTVVKARNL
jgi:prepilin-type N-terminal cleavage/methylation domain-containing protein